MARAKVKAGGILRRSSDSTWRTPERLRAAIRIYYEGTPFLDPCAPPDNPLGASRFYCGPDPSRVPSEGPLFGGPPDHEPNRLDGLDQPWDLPWFCNPPFAQADEWAAKGLRELAAWRGTEGLLLLPVNRTEEPWLQDLLGQARRILFVRWPDTVKLRARIPFESSIDGVEVDKNPFASWILGFGELTGKRWRRALGEFGRTLKVEAV